MSKSKNKSLFVTWLAIMLASAALADVDQSIAGLSDRDWQVRRAAAQSLGVSGSTDKAVVAVLTTALKDPDSRVRRSAADALGHIGEKARTAIPAMVEAFDDMDPSVVAAAARATGQMGTRASRATGDLTALLDHDNASVREAASESLGNLGRRANKSAFDLNGRLRDPDPGVRAAAAVSLGQLGPRSKASITDLIRVLGDEDDSVREAASGALVRMGKKAVPNLVRALQNGNPIFLQAVVDTLGRIGPVAVPRLSEALLEDRTPDIARGYAAMALAQIADRNDTVIATLTEALEDPSANVRMSAAEALGHAGALAKPASAKLIADQRRGSACAGFRSIPANLFWCGSLLYRPWQRLRRVMRLSRRRWYMRFPMATREFTRRPSTPCCACASGVRVRPLSIRELRNSSVNSRVAAQLQPMRSD